MCAKKLWVLALLFAGCASMRAEVAIDAPAETVWAALTELNNYHGWNPFLVEAKGHLIEGQTIDLTMQPVGGKPRAFRPKILKVVEGKEITWRGRLGVPGLFDGTHHLKVEASDPAHARFVQEEDFSGLLVPFASLEPYRLGWEKMNRALKDRCENMSSRMSPAR
jgi:hypothetical protein